MVHHTIRNVPRDTVQELHRCFAPLLKRGNLLDVTMLNVAEKDLVTPPIPTERASSQERKPEPWEEDPTTLPTHNRQEECCLFGRISHGVEVISTCTTWIYWVMGR